MALWQFVLEAIPASEARIEGVAAIRLTREQLDKRMTMLPRIDEPILFAKLEELLPEKASWSARRRIWGDEQTDDVQIRFAEDGIEFVQVRFDVSNLSLPLIGGICEIARQFDWVFA